MNSFLDSSVTLSVLYHLPAIQHYMQAENRLHTTRLDDGSFSGSSVGTFIAEINQLEVVR